MDSRKIESAINEWISSPELFLVELKIDRDNRITVLLDSDTDIRIDQCISLTRFIEARFDREEEDYDLTVSSYGLNQPLILDRQLQKYLDKPVEVSPPEGKMFKAVLKAFDDSSFTFEMTLSKKEIKEGISPLITIERVAVRKIQPHITF
jgi:ribosome maturation factor RimP